MNNITRVLVSVVLLGACAAAMRFTMFTVDAPASKRQLHSARLAVQKAKEIKFHIEAQGVDGFIMQAGQAGRVAGSVLGAADDQLNLVQNTKKGSTEYIYSVGKKTHQNFLWSKPTFRKDAEVRLPLGVPLMLEVFVDNNSGIHQSQIDLRNLNIKKFSLDHSFSNGSRRIQIRLPRSQPGTEFFLGAGRDVLQVEIDKNTQGYMWIPAYPKAGNISIATDPQKALEIIVTGHDKSGDGLKKRLSHNFGKELKIQEPRFLGRTTDGKNEWVIVIKTKSDSKNPFKIDIQLGKQSTFGLSKWTGNR
jgi:hypothetical protein